LAFADYEAETFNLDETPPFCKTLVTGSSSFILRLSSLSALPYRKRFLRYNFLFAG